MERRTTVMYGTRPEPRVGITVWVDFRRFKIEVTVTTIVGDLQDELLLKVKPEDRPEVEFKWSYGGAPVGLEPNSMFYENIEALGGSGSKEFIVIVGKGGPLVEYPDEEEQEMESDRADRSPSDDGVEILKNASFRYQRHLIQLTNIELNKRARWLEMSAEDSVAYLDELQYGPPTNAKPLKSQRCPVKFVETWNPFKAESMRYEPLKFPGVPLRDIRSQNAIIAIHEYRALAKKIGGTPTSFLHAYFNYAIMPPVGIFVSRPDLNLYHARQRCDFNGVYIPELTENQSELLYHLNLHPQETNEKLLTFVHEILKPPKGKSGEESKSTIWKNGTLDSENDSNVKSLVARFPDSECFWEGVPNLVD